MARHLLIYFYAPPASELTHWYDALVPRIDYRDIFSEVFTWMGVDPESVFDDNYSYSRIGFI